VVLDVFVPDPDRAGDGVRVRTITADRLVLSVTSTDIEQQRAVGHFVDLVDGEPVRLRPWVVRWATPAQLDAMAGAAGLELAHRWGGWDGEPFDTRSTRHVSIWRRIADLG